MLGDQLLAWTEKMDEWSWDKTMQLVLIALFTFLLALFPFQSFFVVDEVHFFFYTFLVFLACLYRPGWAFLFLVAVLPLETTNLLPASFGVSIRPYQLLTILLSLALGVQFLTKKIHWPLFAFTKEDTGVLVLLGAALIATPGALVVNTALKESVVLALFVLLYFLLRYFLSQKKYLQESILAFGIGALVVLLVAFGQSIAFLQGKNGAMVMEGRPNASFFEADWLGFFVAALAVVGMALFWALYKTKKHRKQPVVFGANVVFAGASFVVLVLTVARSAWLAFFVSMGVLLLGGVYFVTRGWWKKKILVWSIVTISSVIVVSLGIIWVTGLTRFDISNRLTSTATGEQLITVACDNPTMLPERIASVTELAAYHCEHIRLEDKEAQKAQGKSIQEINRQDPNFHTRSAIYQQGFGIIQEHPILGIGGGNSSILLGTDERGAGLNASNLFLEAWISFGILGLGALVFVLGSLAFLLVQETLKGSEKHLLALALLALLVVFNMFNAGMLLGVFFGLLAYLATVAEEKAHAVHLPTDFKIL